MIRLKQLNIDPCSKQHKLKRNQAMSLYDERSKEGVDKSPDEDLESQNQMKKDFTKEKTETWNKWRIPMKTKTLLFAMMMLIVMITGLTTTVEAADASALITEWTIPVDGDGVTGAGTTITLPIPSNASNSYTVDWGDDIFGEYTTEAFPTHTYANTEEESYVIKIEGTVNLFGYNRNIVPTETGVYSNYYTFTQYLTGITAWGELETTLYGFANCVNLAGTLPTPTANSFANVTNFDYAFYNCSNLGPSVSTEIFDTATNATSFDSAFAGCMGLTSANINLATIDNQMFYACNNLTDITIGNELQTIELDAFQATAPYNETNYLATNLTSTNSVAINYDWESDYRGLGYGGEIHDLTSATVTLNPSSYTYDGKPKTPTATVVVDGGTLTKDTHYTITYENNTEVGIATAVITGIGNYLGTIRENFIINPANVDNDDYYVDTLGPTISNLSGTAESNITITATITDPNLADGSAGSGVNTSATRYAVTTSNSAPATDSTVWQTSNIITNTYQGEIFIWVKAVDNVGNETIKGSSLTATIDISTLDITLSPTTFVYDGTAKKPTVTVKDGTTTLAEGTDYTVGHDTNPNVGTRTVTITGNGYYTGTATRTFTITRKPISVPSGATLEYNGSAQTGVASGTGYTLTGTTSATNVNTYTATATLDSNHMWSDNSTLAKTITWKITQKAVTVTANAQSIVYGDSIAQGTSYATLSNAVNGHSLSAVTLSTTKTTVGTGTITASNAKIKDGSGNDVTDNYAISYATGSLTISAKSLTSTEISASLPKTLYDYTGSAITPTPVVKDGTTTLVIGTDYTVSHTNHTDVGSATDATIANRPTVTITGKGNYTGEIKLYFTITAVAPKITVSDKTVTYSGSVVSIDTATIEGVSGGTTPDGAITYTYYTNANCTTKTSATDNSGATASGGAPKNTGTYYVKATIAAKGNYTAATSEKATITINTKELTITWSNTSLAFTGNSQKPTAGTNNTMSGVTGETVNFTVTGEQSAVGGPYTATATISSVTGTNNKVSNYSIKNPTTPFYITNDNVSLNATVSPTTFVYDGTAKSPTVTVTTVVGGSTKILTEGTDYTVSHDTSKDVGTKTVTITGKGDYAGKGTTATFTITPKPLTYTPTSGQSKVYGTANPTLTGSFSGNVDSSNPGTNGALTREEGEDVGTYNITQGTLTLADNGTFKASNYTLSFKTGVTFEITPKNIAELSLSLAQATYTYDGTAKQPGLSAISYAGKSLVLGTDYTIAHANNTNAGQATATITGKGNFNGSKQLTFTIQAKQITNEMVTISPTSFVYNANNQGPTTIAVKDGNTNLTSGTDYTVSGTTTAKDANTYTITVTGKGNYTGSVNKTWTIGQANNTLVVTGKTGLSYTGNAQELVSVSNAQGEVYFAIGTELTSTNYDKVGTTDIPTGTEAKSYTIYYYTPGNQNHKAASGSVTASIGNSGMTGIVANGYTGVYDGAYHGITVSLSGTSAGATVKYGTVAGTYDKTESPTYKDVNTYTVYYQVTKENYDTATGSAKVTITAKPVSNLTITLSPTTFVYNTSNQGPTIKVKDGNTDLTSGTDYTISGTTTAKDANTYTVTVTGKGNYSGSVSKTWTIAQAENPLNVTGKTGLVYNENEQELVTVTDKQGAVYYAIGTELTSSNYDTAGSTEIPTGKDAKEYHIYYYTPGNTNYKPASGNVKVSIAIADMTGITVNGYEGIYNGNAYGITVNLSDTSAGATVKYGTVEGTYDLNNTPKYTKAGEYTVYYQITKANYNTVTGSAKVVITAKSVSGLTITLEPDSFVYNKEAQGPNITVKDGTTTLTLNTEYTISGSTTGINVGSYTITITGANNYAGTKNATFGITKADNTLTVIGKTGLNYTGNAQELVTVNNAQGDVYFAIGTELTADNYSTAGNKTIPTGTAADKYEVYYYTDGNNNYKATSGKVTVTIGISGMTGITAKGYTGVYDGAYHGITVTLSGSSEGATIKYGTVEGTYNLENSPTYKDVNTYTVYYQVTKENYDTVTGSAVIRITAKSIDDLELTFTPTSFVYNAQNQGPTITLKDDGTTLSATTDYTLSGTLTAKDVGTYSIKITTKGNYTGEVTKTYTITPMTPSIELEDKEVTYTGSAITIDAAKVTGAAGDITPNGTVTYTYYTDSACSIKTSTSVGANTTGGAPVKVGTYYVKATISADGNYGVATSEAVTLKINAKSLINSDIVATLNQTTYIYDGIAKEPGTTVVDRTITLNKGTDYIVEYSNNTNAADKNDANAPTVTITGIGNYVDTITLKFTITQRAQDITLTNYSGTYDGSAHTITVGGSDITGATITYDTDISDGTYDMTTLPTFTNKGTYTVYVKVEKPNTTTFTGSATVEIKVKEVAVIWGNTTLDYTGNPQKPTATVNSGVTNENIVLDITGEATNIGENYKATATINRIEGGQGDKNNYKLTNAETAYKIITPEGIQIEINFDGMGVGEELSQEYNGTKHEPNVEVRIKGTSTELTLNKDYSVAYENNLNVGTATVRVTPINNYAGVAEAVITFEITKKDLIVIPTANQSSVFGSAANIAYTYTGNVTNTAMDPDTLEVPKFTGSLALAIPAGSDITEIGDAGIYVITKGNLAITNNSPFLANNYNLILNTATVNYEITQKTISELTVDLKDKTLEYNGKAQTPAVAEITFNGNKLVENSDYTVSYKNHINAGIATATITGIGNYKGSKDVTFTIIPKKVNVVWGTTTLYYEEGKAQLPTYSIDSGIATETIVLTVTGAQTEIGSDYKATATITGVTGGQAEVNNYDLGNETVSFDIVISNDSEFIVNFEELANDGTANVVYSGAKHEPDVKVEVAGTTLELTEGTDYKVEYTDNLNVGTATVTVTGLNDFIGLTPVTTTFEITKKDLIVTPNSNQSIIYGGVVDIKYTYSGNVTNTAMDPDTLEEPLFTGKLELSPVSEGIVGIGEVGTYKIILGNLALTDNSPFLAGNYNLVLNPTEVSFTITKKDISELTCSLTKAEYVYDGLEKQPDVNMTFNGEKLVKGRDYTLTYTNNIDAGTATVTVTGEGKYTGTRYFTFTIKPMEITITWSNTLLSHTGSVQAPTVGDTAGANGEVIKFTVSGAQTNVGTNYTATASIAEVVGGRADKDNYTITNPTTLFTITSQAVPKAPIIKATLSTFGGTTYISGAHTNKSVLIELTTTEAIDVYKYEWSTSANTGFTASNLFTSNEIGRIRFDSEMNQVIYFRLQDRNGNYSDVSSITINIDKTLPTGSVDIIEMYEKDGLKYTNTHIVDIDITASDNKSDTSNIDVSLINEEDFDWSNSNADLVWMDYEPTMTWELTPGEGWKKVYAIFRDEAGNQSVYLLEVDTSN